MSQVVIKEEVDLGTFEGIDEDGLTERGRGPAYYGLQSREKRKGADGGDNVIEEMLRRRHDLHGKICQVICERLKDAGEHLEGDIQYEVARDALIRGKFNNKSINYPKQDSLRKSTVAAVANIDYNYGGTSTSTSYGINGKGDLITLTDKLASPYCISRSSSNNFSVPKHRETDATGKTYSLHSNTDREVQDQTSSLRTLTKLRVFGCQECNRFYNNKRAFQNHMGIVHTNVRKYLCAECPRRCFNKSQLTVHMRVHTKERPFQCKHCPKLFSSSTGLKSHMKVHTGIRVFLCEHCGKLFSHGGGLGSHIRRMHLKLKPYSCDICPRSFLRKTHLRIHIKTHSVNRARLHSCTRCNKSFMTKNYLVTHMRRTHIGQKPYSCPQCDKRFLFTDCLTRHVRTHTGEKPFVCSKCNKCYTQEAALYLHTLTHTSERPYGCEHCQRRFTQKIVLIHHLRTHTGEKPYKCKQCGRRFYQKPLLNYHIRWRCGKGTDKKRSGIKVLNKKLD